MAAPSLESWIDDLQSRGRYSFHRSEAVQEGGRSADAVGKALQRAVRSGRLVRPKEYFFVIVPLEYRAAGAPPMSWFIHDLMAAMGLPYYVALLSAAALHGASHQQPQVFQVMSDRSVRPMVCGRTQIRLFASKHVGRARTTEVKTPTGSMRVSTPETTVVDLVRFARAAGQIDHVASVIGELAELLQPTRLVAALRLVDDTPSAQRLGYILDRLRWNELAESVRRWVTPRIARFQPLRPGQSAEHVREDRRWQLLISRPLEVEA